MGALGQYILSVIAAAIICSIILRLVGDKGSYAPVMKLLCGIFLMITAVSPWIELRLENYVWIAESTMLDADEAVAVGQEAANSAMRTIIKDNAEAYILDKAAQLNASIEVEIILDSAQPPAPESIRIRGTASPYAKTCLKQYISSQLGIPEDKQIWT